MVLNSDAFVAGCRAELTKVAGNQRLKATLVRDILSVSKLPRRSESRRALANEAMYALDMAKDDAAMKGVARQLRQRVEPKSSQFARGGEYVDRRSMYERETARREMANLNMQRRMERAQVADLTGIGGMTGAYAGLFGGAATAGKATGPRREGESRAEYMRRLRRNTSVGAWGGMLGGALLGGAGGRALTMHNARREAARIQAQMVP